MIKVKEIFVNNYSSKYGENNNVFGQPLGVKSITIISVKSYCGLVRSHELYAGIYVPELIPNLVSYISSLYLEKNYDYLSILNCTNNIPFVCNTGLFKAIKGAVESCILQLVWTSNNISLVEGLRNLLNENIRDYNLNSNKYYASGGSVAYSEKQCISDAEKTIGEGFDGFKMRCGFQAFEKDISRVKEVFNFIESNKTKKNFRLMIDFIQGTIYPKLNHEKLKEYLKVFKNFDIFWFEESLDPDNVFLYENLDKELRRNFSLGESFTSFNEYFAYRDIVNIFQIDVTHIGGFVEAAKVLNYFSKKGNTKLFTSHVWGSKLSLLLNLAMFKACNLIEWFEVPLLSFELNNHLFQDKQNDINQISEEDIDMLLSNLNLEKDPKYEFIKGSGYKI